MNELYDIIKDYKEACERFNEKAQAIVGERIVKFLTDFPEVKSVKWTQYTPYFNDGDTCVFGIGDIQFSHLDDAEYEAGDFDFPFVNLGEWICDEAAKGTDWAVKRVEKFKLYKTIYPRFDEVCAEVQKITEMIHFVPAEVFESAFGDSVLVICTRDGIVTEEYDHD
jgi:hypothetical protein